MNSTHLKVKDLPKNERPYEKCESQGAEALSDAELLAVIIKSGTQELRATDVAMNILNLCNLHGGLSALNHINTRELTALPGVGRVKALQLKCLAELSTRIAASERIRYVRFDAPNTVAAYYMESMRHLEYEELVVAYLDQRNNFIRDRVITIGSINQSVMEPRDIYRDALNNNASHIVVLHNHPSGDPSPSQSDIGSTERLQKAGLMLGITLSDHIIIGDRTYFSFAEEGLLKKH